MAAVTQHRPRHLSGKQPKPYSIAYGHVYGPAYGLGQRHYPLCASLSLPTEAAPCPCASGLLIEATWHCTKVLINKGNILEGIGYIWLHMQRNIGIREVLQDIVLNLSGNIVGLL